MKHPNVHVSMRPSDLDMRVLGVWGLGVSHAMCHSERQTDGVCDI